MKTIISQTLLFFLLSRTKKYFEVLHSTLESHELRALRA
jgi:hypothetical protein